MSLPAPPTATAHNETEPPGTSILLSTLFTYSAASGDSIVGFDVEETSNNGGIAPCFVELGETGYRE